MNNKLHRTSENPILKASYLKNKFERNIFMKINDLWSRIAKATFIITSFIQMLIVLLPEKLNVELLLPYHDMGKNAVIVGFVLTMLAFWKTMKIDDRKEISDSSIQTEIEEMSNNNIGFLQKYEYIISSILGIRI